MCLRETVARLHEDGSGNTVLLNYGLKIRWRIVTIEYSQVRVHPWIIKSAQLPEVLVTIDNHKTQVSSSSSETSLVFSFPRLLGALEFMILFRLTLTFKGDGGY